jgi:hypothetical protein
MRIGVDVGGTNTDAVLLSGRNVLGAVKRPTSKDVSSGIAEAITALISECAITPDAIDAVMIGTTHFTNAFIQRRELVPVFAIRIGFPPGAAFLRSPPGPTISRRWCAADRRWCAAASNLTGAKSPRWMKPPSSPLSSKRARRASARSPFPASSAS